MNPKDLSYAAEAIKNNTARDSTYTEDERGNQISGGTSQDLQAVNEGARGLPRVLETCVSRLSQGLHVRVTKPLIRKICAPDVTPQ